MKLMNEQLKIIITTHGLRAGQPQNAVHVKNVFQLF